MRRLFGLLMLLAADLATFSHHSAASAQPMPGLDHLPSFPGAEGHGSKTRGGRGGKVIAVTNVNDSGPGSLRAAVEAKGPRMVVFRVSGTIDLESRLTISNPYITVAGRSNALSGMVDANVTAPVIACPPYSDEYGGADLYSSLRMPSGVAPAVVLEPASAALLAAKILAVADAALRKRIAAAQRAQTQHLIDTDREVRSSDAT